jgi:hypothetical protein
VDNERKELAHVSSFCSPDADEPVVCRLWQCSSSSTNHSSGCANNGSRANRSSRADGSSRCANNGSRTDCGSRADGNAE